MPKSVLFVTHDRGPGKFGPPIAEKLKEFGHTVFVAAAGPSVESWQKAGFQVPDNLKLNPTVINTLMERSNVIVLGMSSPSRFERQFAEVVLADRAAGHGTPLLVGIVDAWGAYHRMPALDAYLTLDGLDPAAIKAPQSPRRGVQTFIMGDLDPAVSVPDETMELVKPILARHEHVVQLASQKWPESRKIFELALAAGEISLAHGKDLVFIESIHPGAGDTVKVELGVILDAFNEWRPGQIYRLRTKKGKPLNGDHVAHLVKKVIAATGTALRIAAYDPAGIPICAWSEALGEMILKESGTRMHPLAVAKMVVDLSRDIDLVAAINTERERIARRRAEIGVVRVPFNPMGAARFIASL